MSNEIEEVPGTGWSSMSTRVKAIRLLIIWGTILGAYIAFGFNDAIDSDFLANWIITGKPFTFTPPPGWVEYEKMHEQASKAGAKMVWQYGPADMVEEAKTKETGLSENITIILYPNQSNMTSAESVMSFSMEEKKRVFNGMFTQAGLKADFEQRSIAPYVDFPDYSVIAQELIVRFPCQSRLNITHIFTGKNALMRIIVDYNGPADGFEDFESNFANSLLTID